MAHTGWRRVTGSRIGRLEEAAPIRPVDPDMPLEVTVVLRPSTEPAPVDLDGLPFYSASAQET